MDNDRDIQFGDVWETFGNSILLLSYLVMYVHVVQSLSFIYIYIYIYIYSETCLNRTPSIQKTCLSQTDFTIPSDDLLNVYVI
jgi:hypothetical protein